ncbi:BREX-1 system adenine-specific DNA-methyltransferase PglX [Alcaligenaceae bacterium]|nr:BREX-1 system adenine-specific DNA-methyltransferase PglX [Alcaligenaceae bacterium]
MDTKILRQFAQQARRNLIEHVATKLELVLSTTSAARRENTPAVLQLEKQIADTSRAQVIEKVAYTWFNRFCALRFMDANGYTRIRVVSPADETQIQPEILADAKMGHMDADRVPERTRSQVQALLSGKAPSQNPEQEAYRLLLVAECNSFNRVMPYLFERIADYTELLIPDDLLSANSILAATREAMTADNCQDVEVIGWLYQFYISEKKDEVFAGLKKSQKVTPENIPAATQLFTPHWIVRYLVENSLGRLWMLNHPNSPLAGQMAYYIKPEAPETDFLKITKPEDIKVCDPACGSGHMLTYAFDLLYAIYEEVGTDPSDIPEKILTYNLYGIELDERAGDLAAFALTMKARAKQRRFFEKGIEPNICVLEKITFDDDELTEYMTMVGHDLFTLDLRETLTQFEEADNFGSLIRPKLSNVQDVLRELEAKDMAGNLFLTGTHDKVLKVLQQADYLSAKYHVVVANPPYMGGKGMNARLGAWLKENYEPVKTDLFSAFVVRNTHLAVPKGQLGFMTPFVWMFISSYEKLRSFLIDQKTITSLIQLEYSGFDGATVPICTFTVENMHKPDFKGGYVRLSDFRGADQQGPRVLEIIQAANRIGK